MTNTHCEIPEEIHEIHTLIFTENVTAHEIQVQALRAKQKNAVAEGLLKCSDITEQQANTL